MTVDEKAAAKKENLKRMIDYSDFVTLKLLVGFISAVKSCRSITNDKILKKKKEERTIP